MASPTEARTIAEWARDTFDLGQAATDRLAEVLTYGPEYQRGTADDLVTARLRHVDDLDYARTYVWRALSRALGMPITRELWSDVVHAGPGEVAETLARMSEHAEREIELPAGIVIDWI